MNFRHLTEEQDIAWHKLIRRLEQVGRNGVYSVVSIQILVDECGQPVLWREPDCSKIEPKHNAISIMDELQDALREFAKSP